MFKARNIVQGKGIRMPPRTRPIEKFAQAVGKCSAEVSRLATHVTLLAEIIQASVYGKCIVADYNSIHKDKCLTEFLRLKDCYIVGSKFFIASLLLTTQAAAKKP